MKRTRKKYAKAVVFIVAILAASAAWADQTIYKYHMSDGSTAYTQERSGSGELEATLRVPSTPKATSKRQASQELEKMKEKAEVLAAQRRQQEQQDNKIAEAKRALDLAESSLTANMEPLPEERQINAAGYSFITPSYWLRIQAMQQSIQLARERLDAISNDALAQSSR